MLPTTRIALFFLALSTIAACRPDEHDVAAPQPAPPPNLEVAAFSNLAAGNYWVYQKYSVDSADNVIQTLSVDSFFVTGDSVVNGVTYRKVHRNMISPITTYLWRDSADYLINQYHEVFFCADPLDEVIYTVVQGPVGVQLDYSVYSDPESITVPAGRFTTYKMQCEITSIGGFPELPDWKRLRSYWAEGVGRVRYYEFFALNPTGNRYDLVRYNTGE
jgi:hypothetical protein